MSSCKIHPRCVDGRSLRDEGVRRICHRAAMIGWSDDPRGMIADALTRLAASPMIQYTVHTTVQYDVVEYIDIKYHTVCIYVHDVSNRSKRKEKSITVE
jgi:hypothetical protein